MRQIQISANDLQQQSTILISNQSRIMIELDQFGQGSRHSSAQTKCYCQPAIVIWILAIIVLVFFLCSQAFSFEDSRNSAKERVFPNQYGQSEQNISKKHVPLDKLSGESQQNKVKQFQERQKIEQKVVYSNTTTSKGEKISNEHRQNKTTSQRKKTFTYPTVGIPEPGQQFNFSVVNMQQMHIFDEEINQLFKPYNDTNCEIVRIGSKSDGGYLICSNFIFHSQVVLNFGIEEGDDFGCDLTSKFLMPNYQYDCTIKDAPKCLTNNKLSLFKKICVGETAETTWMGTFQSLQSILLEKNLSKKYIILKSDTEGAEFPAFRYLPTQYLDYIDQIIMEVHFKTFYQNIWGNLQILRTLSSKFVSLNYHMNNFGCYLGAQTYFRKLPSHAFQVTLVNKRLITLNSDSRSFKSHPLNRVNTENSPDCQIPL